MKRAALLLAGALVRWGRDFFVKGKDGKKEDGRWKRAEG